MLCSANNYGVNYFRLLDMCVYIWGRTKSLVSNVAGAWVLYLAGRCSHATPCFMEFSLYSANTGAGGCGPSVSPKFELLISSNSERCNSCLSSQVAHGNYQLWSEKLFPQNVRLSFLNFLPSNKVMFVKSC